MRILTMIDEAFLVFIESSFIYVETIVSFTGRKSRMRKELNGKLSNSSAIYLLARLKRTRSVWRPPYEDKDRKTLMKARFQRIFLS